MRLTQLRSFHAVAVTGSFTRAARLLNVSQPTVTMQVRLLEDAYHVQLFHRGARRVTPTRLGERLALISQQVFGLEAEASQLLRDEGELRSGDLRLASVGPKHVTRMLFEFNRRFPGIRVSVTTCNTQDVIDRVLDHRADIGVLAQFLEDERFHSLPVGRYPIVLFVPARHRLAKRRSVRLAELAGERWIQREEGSTTRRAMAAAMKRVGVDAETVMESSSRELIRDCVASGLGIAAVSEIEFAPGPDVHMLRISDGDLFIDAHLVCLAERAGLRLVSAFLESALAVAP